MNVETLAKIAGTRASANMHSFLAGMEAGGKLIDWPNPVVQLHLLPQVGHESGGFRYDREIWGPTSVQRRYEDRSDLGHSSRVANEAFDFRGKGPIQLTGRYNHAEYYKWCMSAEVRAITGKVPPDFEINPEAMLTDPWEGLSVVFYWHTRGLTRLALENDFENITKRINGGYNGLSDRMRWFGRTGLVLLGRDPLSIVGYQREKGLTADGIVGTNTRRALFEDVKQIGAVNPPVNEKPADESSWRQFVAKQLSELNTRITQLERG